MKPGDIMENQWFEKRIITAVSGDICYYVDWRDAEGYFYNPCKACVSLKTMKTWKKVGEITGEYLEDFFSDLTIFIRQFNKVFYEFNLNFNESEKYGNKYDIKQFIKRT